MRLSIAFVDYERIMASWFAGDYVSYFRSVCVAMAYWSFVWAIGQLNAQDFPLSAHDMIALYRRASGYDIEWSIRTAYEYMNDGEPQVAIDVINKSLAVHPESAVLYLARGDAYLSLNGIIVGFAKAYDGYSRAIELDPEEHPRHLFYRARGELILRCQRFEPVWLHRALNDFDHALELCPSDYISLTLRGSTYYHLGETTRARSDFMKAVEISPNCSTALNNLGLLYDENGDLDKALVYYSKAIEGTPKTAMHRENRAYLYKRLNRWQEVITDLDKALELNPGNAWSYLYRGEAKLHLGKPCCAIEDLTMAMNLDKGLTAQARPLVERARAMLERGP